MFQSRIRYELITDIVPYDTNHERWQAIVQQVIYIGAIIEQIVNHLRVAVQHGDYQGRIAFIVAHVHINKWPEFFESADVSVAAGAQKLNGVCLDEAWRRIQIPIAALETVCVEVDHVLHVLLEVGEALVVLENLEQMRRDILNLGTEIRNSN